MAPHASVLPPMISKIQRPLTIVLLIGVVIGLEMGFELIVPDAAWRQLALFAMVNVIVALSLNVINGMAGQFSIGHAGFVGIGEHIFQLGSDQQRDIIMLRPVTLA